MNSPSRDSTVRPTRTVSVGQSEEDTTGLQTGDLVERPSTIDGLERKIERLVFNLRIQTVLWLLFLSFSVLMWLSLRGKWWSPSSLHEAFFAWPFTLPILSGLTIALMFRRYLAVRMSAWLQTGCCAYLLAMFTLTVFFPRFPWYPVSDARCGLKEALHLFVFWVSLPLCCALLSIHASHLARQIWQVGYTLKGKKRTDASN